MFEHALRRNAVSVALSLGFLLMSFLCVQQARTIASQRSLIRSLFQDSLELNALKVKHIQEMMRH
jgi:hypothetical protein